MGVDGEHIPLDAVGQPRQQGSPQTDGCAGAQAFGLPPGSVAERDVDTFILEVPLLIGHIRDQFFVDPTPDMGQVNRVRWQNNSSPNLGRGRARCVHSLQRPRSPECSGR
jgi:hypothetical protein